MDKVSFVTFDWKVYLSKYPDLQEAGILTAEALWRHFRKFGKAEGRTHRQDLTPESEQVSLVPVIERPVSPILPPSPEPEEPGLVSKEPELEEPVLVSEEPELEEPGLVSEESEPEEPGLVSEEPEPEEPGFVSGEPVLGQGITLTIGEPNPIAPVEKKTRKRATKTK